MKNCKSSSTANTPCRMITRYQNKKHWIPERENLEQSEIERRENTNLRIVEWMRDLKNKGEEAQSIQPVYYPNRGKLNPRELYAILHVVFAETEITVHLHRKYYLSIARALGGSGGLELGGKRLSS